MRASGIVTAVLFVSTNILASAWIIPQDFDRDGDLDLFGTIESKPAADLHFWINEGIQTQPRFLTPLAKGKNVPLLTPGNVHGPWRLLSPGFEYLDWFQHGLTRKKALVLPQAAVDNVIWSPADYNGDGHCDVIVFSLIATDGKARIFYGRADGSFAMPFVLQADGKDLDSTGIRSPHFVNLDDDDDLDLIHLDAKGRMIYYENSNTNSEPLYAAGQPLGSDALRMIVPFDWDGDALTDLIVETREGKIGWMKQSATDGKGPPVFTKPVVLLP